MTTGKTIALTRWTSVSKVISLLFIILSRFVIAFLTSLRKKESNRRELVHLFIPAYTHPEYLCLRFTYLSFVSKSEHAKLFSKDPTNASDFALLLFLLVFFNWFCSSKQSCPERRGLPKGTLVNLFFNPYMHWNQCFHFFSPLPFFPEKLLGFNRK